MASKKEKSCNYYEYYRSQTGGSLQNEILVYRGKPYQRGSGFFSNFRYAIPFLKKIGKETLDIGKNILFDIASGHDFKSATKRSLKRKASEMLKKASDKLEQIGTGKLRIKRIKTKNNKKNKLNLQSGGRKKNLKTKTKQKVKKRKSIKRPKNNRNKSVFKRRSQKKHRSKADIFM